MRKDANVCYRGVCHTSLVDKEYTVTYGNKRNIEWFSSAKKRLPAGKSTCRDLPYRIPRSYDDRTIASMLSKPFSYIRNRLLPGNQHSAGEAQVGVTYTFDAGANEKNVHTGIILQG